MNGNTKVAYVSAAIYGSLSAGAALLFFLITAVSGDYTWVARIGGAGWVLLLSLIISMPTVTPWVKRRLGARPDEHGAEPQRGHGH